MGPAGSSILWFVGIKLIFWFRTAITALLAGIFSGDKLSVWCRREKLSVFALLITATVIRHKQHCTELHNIMVHGIYSCVHYLIRCIV